MVKLGEARYDERGMLSYGKPGDQTGKEISIVEAYNDKSRPWTFVYRAKDPNKRKQIAANMISACENNNIGYAQYGVDTASSRYGMYQEMIANNLRISAISKPCNVDCSALVANCLIAAGIPVTRFMSTATEQAALRNTGAFVEMTYSEGMELLTGDILFRVGHTAIITSAGDEPKKNLYQATTDLYLRTGPSIIYPKCKIELYDGRGIRNHLYKGEVVEVIGQKNGWAETNIVGRYTWNPWCSMRYLKKV